MGELVKLRKSGKNLIIALPPEICEMLSLKEGSKVEIEPFTCGGEVGARLKPKN
jgi:antitoxin component of MazEF toxin-antitoxin module